jgi:hypothetical protein
MSDGSQVTSREKNKLYANISKKMTLIFRLLFKASNMGILKTLIRERKNGDLSQTIKKIIAKTMRIYCELSLILLRYTKHLVSRNGESSLML